MRCEVLLPVRGLKCNVQIEDIYSFVAPEPLLLHRKSRRHVYSPVDDDRYVVDLYQVKAGVVLVCDVFSFLPKSKAIPDILAEHGFLAVMPDFFGVLAWPESECLADFQLGR
ncbi:similarity to endo-1-like protein [Leishmania tarentolae]|uniref:Similarity to endo-1-like protein n=1 Tax=Leishmania tarentolae TaxID=5689 RepID=A0A640KW42_LEITA|nr:similarity to endo-1-like protein [Leishmania tarentolae]